MAWLAIYIFCFVLFIPYTDKAQDPERQGKSGPGHAPGLGQTQVGVRVCVRVWEWVSDKH